MHARGFELVIVGSGAPMFAAAFAERIGLDTPILVDPSLAAFAAGEFKRPILGFWRPGLWAAVWRAARAGHRQGRTRGDALQLGGVLVIDAESRGATVLFRHISNYAGDHPKPERVLAAIPGS